MNRDLQNLEDLLVLLREQGVVSYQFGALSVVLGPLPPGEDTEVKTARQDDLAETQRSAVQTSYDHPSLWPGGKRPSFKDK